MKAIIFAEWLAENHYVLINIDKSGVRFWKNEKNQKTSKQLYKEYEKETIKPTKNKQNNGLPLEAWRQQRIGK